MSEPLESIDKLVNGFFDSFDNRSSRVPDYKIFKNYFIAESLIGNRSGSDLSVWPVFEFWEPRKDLLTNGRLTEFHEWETGAKTSIFNGIANRHSSYQKEGLLDGLPYTGKGTKMFQLVLTQNGWRIAYLLWEDQEELNNKALDLTTSGS